MALVAMLLITGCATTPPDVVGAGTQLETRQAQTREFDTLDKAMTMRSVVATLQDLGFTIDQADAELGTITATRLDTYTMRMTVTVVSKTGDRIAVRAFARVGENAITDPATYQDFFIALDKAMFLTQNQVD
jgi:carbohydrate-binding DOMON domain-containing protein